MGKPLGTRMLLTNAPHSLLEGILGTVPPEPFQPYNVHSLILRAETSNSDDVFIGGVSVDGTSPDTWMKLRGGDFMGFDLPAGDYIDLRNIYAVAGGTHTDYLYIFGIQ